MITKVFVLLILSNIDVLIVSTNVTISGLTRLRNVAKIQYGKHYVTRTFSMFPPTEKSEHCRVSPGKRRVRIRKIRTSTTSPSNSSSLQVSSTSEPTLISISCESVKISSSSLRKILSSLSPKYTTNWGRYTTNYWGATAPYPLKFFPNVLEYKHNISKWWDPDHTEWFNLFTGHTLRTRWYPFTLRVYPFKVLSTIFKPALPGKMNQYLKNYGVTERETDPPNWVHRKYWQMPPPLSEGPCRAYRPVYWYEERNISCPHPVVTNTATPYTGPPLIEFFDCDNFQHNYHYAYDDSQLYSEEARLVDKFGSEKESEDSSDSEELGPDRLRGKVYDPNAKNEEESLTLENLENMRNLSMMKLEESRKRRYRLTADPQLKTSTSKSKRTRKRPQNTTIYDEYEDEGGPDVRDTEEFEYMMQEYMNIEEKQDLAGRKAMRRQIRTICGQIISTIKKKLNTIWWKTFWKQTATTPTKYHPLGKSTPWYRILNTVVADFSYYDKQRDAGSLGVSGEVF